MVKKIYTNKERAALLKNKNVIKLGKGMITYSEDFKIKAVKQYKHEYLTPQEIFIQAGFDLDIMGRKKPKNCLRRWKKEKKKTNKRKGLPKKIKDKSNKDRIERLEAENAYLKEENDFLVKLRAKRNY